MTKALLLLVTACLLTSCSTVQQAMPAQREAKHQALQIQEAQLKVMRFADEYKSRVGEIITRLQASARTQEERLNAQNWKLQQSESIYLIASGANPLTNALDTVVLATLSRMVLEDAWVRELYGDRTQELWETHSSLE